MVIGKLEPQKGLGAIVEFAGPASALWEAGGWVWGSADGDLSFRVQSGSLRFGLRLRPEVGA